MIIDKIILTIIILMAAMNKVHDKLYLGNIKAASDLKLLKSVVR